MKGESSELQSKKTFIIVGMFGGHLVPMDEM